MRLWLVWVVFASLPTSAANLENPSNLNAWLSHVAKATQQLNYEGTYIYQHDDSVEISHIAHRKDNSEEFAKLDALSGPPHTFVRVNDAVYCYIPEGNQVKVERHQYHKFFPSMLPLPTTPITLLYTLKSLGRAHIADHDSFGVSLTPRDDYRYGYSVWADMATGLLLKLVKFDADQQMSGQFTFTQVDIGEAPDRKQFQSGVVGKKSVAIPDREVQVQTHWRISKLPDGFYLVMETQRDLPGKTQSVIHQVYTDGLATVSLFIEPLSQLGSNPPRGLSSHGMMSLYARPVGAYQVTALGEVPPATIMMMADNLNQETSK
jgi:sigma-E factor negative regulatory protein RseB